MEAEITGFRIANSILQDTEYSGEYLLVEGVKDIRLYKKFVREELRVKATFGKYNLRAAYDILVKESFDRVFGIRDADFLRIANNPKFDPNYVNAIFVTDNHDSEVMMIDSKALTDFLLVVSDTEKIKKFEALVGFTIRELLYALGYAIGCLKLANKRYGLGLVFKPERPDGNVIKYKRFICDKKFTYSSNDDLVDAVIDYSRNRKTNLAARSEILNCLGVVMAEGHNVREIVGGHDLAEILYLVVTKGLGSSSSLLRNSDSVENSLILSYDITQFCKTQLYSQIDSYQKSRGISII